MAQKYADDSGMEQLAQIVAGLYKDVKLIKSASNLAGAQRYASKRNGWIASKEDITGPNKVPDGVDEILIRDKHGKIRVVNGWTTKPSKFAERQAYWDNVPLWTKAELDARTDLSPLRKQLMINRPKKTMAEFRNDLYLMTPEYDAQDRYTGKWNYAINDFQGGAANVSRSNKSISPKKIFISMFKENWENFKDQIPAENRLAAFRDWSNGEYIQKVVKPALAAIGVNYDELPYAEDVAKHTNKSNFKDAALRILQGYMTNGPIHEDISATLQELINRQFDLATLTQIYGEKKPHKPRANEAEDNDY